MYGINDMIIFRNGDQYSISPLTGKIPFKQNTYCIDIENQLQFKLTVDEISNFVSVEQGDTCSQQFQNCQYTLILEKQDQLSFCGQIENINNVTLALFKKYQFKDKNIIRYLPFDEILNNVIIQRNNQFIQLQNNQIKRINQQNQFYNRKITKFSNLQVKQILDQFKGKTQLNCKIGKFNFKIFVQASNNLVFSDVDGTITLHDICWPFYCLFKKNATTNIKCASGYRRCLNQSNDDSELGNAASLNQSYQPIFVTARNSNKLFKFCTEKTAMHVFSQQLPSIYLLQKGFFSSHAVRTAGKYQFCYLIAQAFKQVYDAKIQGYGNAASDMISFVAAGCNVVELV